MPSMTNSILSENGRDQPGGFHCHGLHVHSDGVDCPSVKPDDELEEALKKMVQSDQEDLPVVDSAGRVIGELNCFELIQAYTSGI